MTGCNGKLNLLTILECFETVALNCTEVDEDIGTPFLFDESVALSLVKPLNGACYL